MQTYSTRGLNLTETQAFAAVTKFLKSQLTSNGAGPAVFNGLGGYQGASTTVDLLVGAHTIRFQVTRHANDPKHVSVQIDRITGPA